MANKRPKRIVVGKAIGRPVRGPASDDLRRFYWQVQIEEHGVRSTLWSGWGTRDEVRDLMVDLVASRPSDEDEALARSSVVQEVRDLLELFTGSLKSRYEAGDLTVYGYQNSVHDSKHLLDHLDGLPVSRLRRAEIEGYRNARRTEKGASSTVKREIKTLRAAWKWARGNELVPDRDLPRVHVKVVPVREKYNPSPEECWLVIDEMTGWSHFVGSFLAITGARIGEIATLKPDAVKHDHVVLRGKSGLRRFPLTPRLREVLESADFGAEYLHGTTPKMVTGHFSSRELIAACRRAKVPVFSSHGFRRAAVDALQRAGVDIKSAADLLGHSPEVMLRYYREVSRDDRMDAANKLAAAMPASSKSRDLAAAPELLAPVAPEPTPEPAPDPTPEPASGRGPHLAEVPDAASVSGQSVTKSDTPRPAEHPKDEGPQGLTSPAGLRNGKKVPKFASVSRARREDEDVSLIGYQRPEVQKHISQIREYIESAGAMVPNAVVIAFGDGTRFIPRIERKRGGPAIEGAQSGTLEIPVSKPGEEKVGFIVDGQQRLAAIRESARESFPVFAVAFVASSDAEQREQFMLVNSTKPLPKGLIHELLPGMQGHLPPHLEKRKLPAELVAHLNHTSGSPLRGIVRTATNPSGRIADNSMLRILETSLSDGVLWEIAQVEEGEKAVEEMCKVLMAFWGAVRIVWEDIWELKPRQSRLLHGAGIVTLGYLMEEMIVRHRGDGWPEQGFFVEQLQLIEADCYWTEGWWEFGGEQRRRWDEIQNVNKDVMMLMNHMTRVYRLRSRGRSAPIPQMPMRASAAQ